MAFGAVYFSWFVSRWMEARMNLIQIGTGGLIVIGWILTARTLLSQSKLISELRERVAKVEARLNDKGRGRGNA